MGQLSTDKVLKTMGHLSNNQNPLILMRMALFQGCIAYVTADKTGDTSTRQK